MAKPWSDLDLAIKAKSALDWKRLAEIKETFQKSELPFRGDVFWIGMKLQQRSVGR
jgi:predicted nucleotidyltransferase